MFHLAGFRGNDNCIIMLKSRSRIFLIKIEKSRSQIKFHIVKSRNQIQFRIVKSRPKIQFLIIIAWSQIQFRIITSPWL